MKVTEEVYALYFLTYEKAYSTAVDQWEANGVGPRMTNHLAHQTALNAVITLAHKLQDADEPIEDKGAGE